MDNSFSHDLGLEPVKMNTDKRYTNLLMQMLGKQDITPLVDGGLNDLKWLAHLYDYDHIPDIVYDAFILGTLHSKRAERRAKRKEEQRE